MVNSTRTKEAADSYYFFTELRLRLKKFVIFLKELLSYPAATIGAVVILLFTLTAVFAPVIVPHEPAKIHIADRLLPPAWSRGGSTEYVLGTDELGRDLLTRIIFGSRVSLLVGILSVFASGIAGTFLGVVAGYYRKSIDTLLSRFADLLLSFPYLIFAIFMMAIIGPGFWNLIFALSFKSWVGFFRLSRGEMISEKTKEYVEAARALGVSNPVIIFREMLPNIIHSILVLGTLQLGHFIILEASLSFLGLGIQPPTPAWGSMINSGRQYMMTAWWVSTLPGIALLVLVLSINLLGEGLRDILDPKLKIE